MNNASYFIKNKALFGSFPKQEDVLELENNGVRYFINLTYTDEKRISPYVTIHEQINYPIEDRKSPISNKFFSKFILDVLKIIKSLNNGDKIYIHCRAGHSRSSLVVSCLLKLYNGYDNIETAILKTREYHNKRPLLKTKWLNKQHLSINQKRFLYKLFENIYFFRAYKDTNITFGFSNYSNHNVYIEGKGIFKNSRIAFNAFKDINNERYVIKQIKAKTVYESNKISQEIKCSYDEILNNMKHIIELKISQHEDVKEKLLNTGFSKLIYNNKNDIFFGIGNGEGNNHLGKILYNLRMKLFENMI